MSDCGCLRAFLLGWPDCLRRTVCLSAVLRLPCACLAQSSGRGGDGARLRKGRGLVERAADQFGEQQRSKSSGVLCEMCLHDFSFVVGGGGREVYRGVLVWFFPVARERVRRAINSSA